MRQQGWRWCGNLRSPCSVVFWSTEQLCEGSQALPNRHGICQVSEGLTAIHVFYWINICWNSKNTLTFQPLFYINQFIPLTQQFSSVSSHRDQQNVFGFRFIFFGNDQSSWLERLSLWNLKLISLFAITCPCDRATFFASYGLNFFALCLDVYVWCEHRGFGDW